jgi:predicted nucleic acid-binding protein
VFLWTWISSTVIDHEVDQTPDFERKRRIETLLSSAHQVVLLTEEIIRRGDEIRQLGFGSFDALHIASAEAGEADVVLTTDDKLIRLAMRHLRELKVLVSNPLQWLQEEMHHG